MPLEDILRQLSQSSEPSIRYKILVGVLGEPATSKKIQALQEEIRASPRVRALLHHHNRQGRLEPPERVYTKWQGAHWVLTTLADIGYPAGDEGLRGAAKQLLDCWLDAEFFQTLEPKSKADIYKKGGVLLLQGRYRRCASQQGNALFSLMRLGLYEARVEQLAERLLAWQWPDGGWNCDKNPAADTSSFVETLWPLRGLVWYAKEKKQPIVEAAIQKAAEVFLSRKLYQRRSDHSVIQEEFLRLHYPPYWHYDILAALKVLAEGGLIKDPRCQDALDRLEEKQLPEGGWPAEKAYYKVSLKLASDTDYASWGGTGQKKMNPWVTADALFVLRAAGRLSLP